MSGAGHPVVFIPGFACSGSVWDPVVAELDGVEAHLVTFAGFAGVPPVSQPSLAGIQAALVHYIQDHGLMNAVVVGHSLGGHMALWLGATAPDVGGVVDVEGFPFLAGADDPAMTQERAEAAVRPKVERFREMTQEDLEAWVRENMSGMFTAAEDRDRVLADSALSDVGTVAQIFGEGVAKDLRDDLSRIEAPTTIVVSCSAEGPDPGQVAQWQEQVASIPQHELVFLHGSHFVMYDRLEAFASLLARVIDSARGLSNDT